LRNRAPGSAKLIFELLVAVLELLDSAGQLPDLSLKALDLQDLIGAWPFSRLLAGLVRLLAEHAANRRQRRTAVLREGAIGNTERGNQGRCRKPAGHRTDHG
jgi:hypothetical protein